MRNDKWTRVWWTAIFVALVLSLGCPGKEPPKGEREIEGDGEKNTLADGTLVQILIYGLSVFELPEAGENQVVVHFPYVMGHKIELARGRKTSADPKKHEWAGFEGNAMPRDVSGKGIRFEGGAGGITVWQEPGDHGDWERYPRDAKDAADSRWMVRAKDLEQNPQNLRFRDNVASSTAILDFGRLETCGLIHEPEAGVEVCRVRETRPHGTTGASEYMVVRHVIAAGETLKIHLTNEDPIVAEPVSLVNCSKYARDGCVEFGEKDYKSVIDIAIRNTPSNVSKRGMETDHMNILRDTFFTGFSGSSWELVSPDCDKTNKVWGCPRCAESVQPKCWGYFLRYRESFSGFQQSVCPFVGFP